MTRTLNYILLLVFGAILFVILLLMLNSPVGGQFKGKGKDKDFFADKDTFHFLLENRDAIRRKVTMRKDGIDSITESDKPAVAARIQEHVGAMHRRIKEGRGIHLRDPLFVEVFRNRDKIEMKLEKTAKGIKVRETSNDPYVARLIQAHAEVVSGFLANGYAEMMKNHPLPKK